MNVTARRRGLRAAIGVIAAALLTLAVPTGMKQLYAQGYPVCCEVNCLFGSCGAEGICECTCMLGFPVCSCVPQNPGG